MSPASRSRSLKRMGLGLGVALLLGCVGWMLVRSYLVTDIASHQCISRLAQIRTALHEYHVKYGELPPLVVRNSEGVPLYSWRVLLTEFLADDLYHAFKLDERWDSPSNLQLARRTTGVFECPAAGASRAGFTAYFAVVELNGDSRFDWLGERQTSPALKRGLVIVETSSLDVEWSRPIDLLNSTILEDQRLGGSLLNCEHNAGPYAIVGGDNLLNNSGGLVQLSVDR